MVQIVKTCCGSLHCCCLLGQCTAEEKGSGPESQLEKYVWQLKILDEVLAASGSEERDQLLKDHQHGELCVLVHTLTEMVILIEKFLDNDFFFLSYFLLKFENTHFSN